MKQYVILVVVLAGIILLNFYQTNFLTKTSYYLLADIKDIENSTIREDYNETLNGVYELENTWNSLKNMWDILGEHDDIQNINEHIAAMRVYALNREKVELCYEMVTLSSLINHVVESENLNLGNIL